MKVKSQTETAGFATGIDLQAIKQRAIAETMASLYTVPPHIEERGDGLDWARRILARIEAGEDVGMRAELYAREALGLK